MLKHLIKFLDFVFCLSLMAAHLQLAVDIYIFRRHRMKHEILASSSRHYLKCPKLSSQFASAADTLSTLWEAAIKVPRWHLFQMKCLCE